MIAQFLKVIITFLIMIGSILGMFDLFSMEMTKPNHDMIIIMTGFMIGMIAYGYMEHVKMFEKRSNV